MDRTHDYETTDEAGAAWFERNRAEAYEGDDRPTRAEAERDEIEDEETDDEETDGARRARAAHAIRATLDGHWSDPGLS